MTGALRLFTRAGNPPVAAYARQANDPELLGWATEIKIRAERRAGELLREMPKNAGEQGQFKPKTGGPKKVPPTNSTPTLSTLGISKNQSSQWQKLAAIPALEFERRLGRVTGHPTMHFCSSLPDAIGQHLLSLIPDTSPTPITE